MKEIIGFIRWGWSSFESWQKIFIAAMLLQILGWFAPSPWGQWISGLGFAVVIGFMIKWFLIDPISASWTKYKQHRNSLLTTIKTSDER